MTGQYSSTVINRKSKFISGLELYHRSLKSKVVFVFLSLAMRKYLIRLDFESGWIDIKGARFLEKEFTTTRKRLLKNDNSFKWLSLVRLIVLETKNSRRQTRGCIVCICCSYSFTFVFMQYTGKDEANFRFKPARKKNDWFRRNWSRKVGRYWPRALTFRILSIINTSYC